MKAYTVDLGKEYGLQGGTLECILAENPWDVNTDWKRPALIVVPGGGYGMCSKREAEPIAFEFLKYGFQAFIFKYVCAPDGRYPEQLFELSAAVDYVKKHAEEMNVNPNEVFAVGFSAGGHLTANLAVEHQNVATKWGREIDCKPTAVGLCYPVISQIHGHQGSYDNLLNGYSEEAKEELLKTLNLDQAVNEQTPPAFIWATVSDKAVPADNALRYAMALDKNGIEYELHMYPRGVHGLSTGSFEINHGGEGLDRIGRWLEDCSKFFRMYIEEKF